MRSLPWDSTLSAEPVPPGQQADRCEQGLLRAVFSAWYQRGGLPCVLVEFVPRL
jgi:hypothetical protein